jgi:hypothetical protein
MMNVEVQQLLNVINAWLEPNDLKVHYDSSDSSEGGRADIRDKRADINDTDAYFRDFPTLPHAIEWALAEASRRIGMRELAQRLDAAFSDDEDGD